MYLSHPNGRDFCITCQKDFTGLAREEVLAAVTDARQVHQFGPGTLLFNSLTPFDKVSENLRRTGSVFVRHVCPATGHFHLHDRDSLIGLLASQTLPSIDLRLSFSIQTRVFGHGSTRAFDVNRALSNRLERSGALLNVREPEQVVSVMVDGSEIWFGVSWASQNLSDWTGGEHRFQRAGDQITRAEFKLLEALAHFDISMAGCCRVLELGSAPGGWTRVLLNSGLRVVGVDPSEMDSRVRSNRNLVHLRMRAEECFPHLSGRFGALLSDMRVEPGRAAELVCKLSTLLAPGAPLIVTLKLRVRDARLVTQRALRVIDTRFDVIGARQLFHNRHEVTVVAIRR